jgi:hypothetical protein
MNCKGTPCASAVSTPATGARSAPWHWRTDRSSPGRCVEGPPYVHPVSGSTYESEVKRHRREIEKQQANRAAADEKVANAEAAAPKRPSDGLRHALRPRSRASSACRSGTTAGQMRASADRAHLGTACGARRVSRLGSRPTRADDGPRLGRGRLIAAPWRLVLPANAPKIWRRWESNPRPRARYGQLLRA